MAISSPPLPSKTPKALFPFVCALALAVVHPVLAETLATLTLDDPQALLSTHPEGLSKLTPAFASSTATIASGSGGRALPQITAGPPAESSGGTADVNVRISSSPPLGAGPFFRALLEGGAVTRQAGLGVMLDKDASLDSLVVQEGGFFKISGGFDFLFRAASHTDFPKVSVMTKIAHLGIVAGITPEDGKLILRLNTAGKSLDTNGDQSGDRNLMEKRSEASLENGAIYHGAVIFRTADDGSLAISFLVSEGAGPLDPSSAVSASVEGIWLLTEPAPSGTDKIVITLGRSETSQQTLDISAVRVFRQVPERLPEFATSPR